MVTGIWEYIKETRDMVHNLESRLQSAKDNVEQIQKIMAMWSKSPLFERFENKNSSLLNLSDRDDRTKKRYEEITSYGTKIHEFLQVPHLSHFANSQGLGGLAVSREFDRWPLCCLVTTFGKLLYVPLSTKQYNLVPV